MNCYKCGRQLIPSGISCVGYDQYNRPINHNMGICPRCNTIYDLDQIQNRNQTQNNYLKVSKEKCRNCGNYLKERLDTVGMDIYRQPVKHVMLVCENCRLRWDTWDLKGVKDDRLTTKNCPICHNIIASNAEQCPRCGYVYEKYDSKHPLLDILCVLSIAITSLMAIIGMWQLAFMIDLFWLIIYFSLYKKAENDPDTDEKHVKRSMYAVFIFFLLQFGFVIII